MVEKSYKNLAFNFPPKRKKYFGFWWRYKLAKAENHIFCLTNDAASRNQAFSRVLKPKEVTFSLKKVKTNSNLFKNNITYKKNLILYDKCLVFRILHHK